MNLRDYIGDTRTESLPPGFLKSIKIKYKHEASNVFPRGAPSSRENEDNEQANAAKEERGDIKHEEKDKTNEEKTGKETPAFMSWRVPSRLLNQRCANQRTGLDTRSIKEANDNVTSLSLSRQSTAPIIGSNISGKYERAKKESFTAAKAASLKLGERTGNNAKENITVLPVVEKKKKGNKLAKSGNSRNNNKQTADDRENAEVAIDAKNGSEGVSEGMGNIQHPNSRKSEKKIISEQIAKKHENMSEKPAQVDDSSEEFPKLDNTLSQLSPPNMHDEDKNGSLPHLGTQKLGTPISQKKQLIPTKLPLRPGSVNKIKIWVKNSTNREKRAAINLLSMFLSNETIQSNKPKKERIQIALQALERKRMPSSIKPLRMSHLTENLSIINHGQQTSEDINHHSPRQPARKDKQRFKTWHRLPAYPGNNLENRSAMFLQPWKCYQRHFSIHPEWGFQEPVPVKTA